MYIYHAPVLIIYSENNDLLITAESNDCTVHKTYLIIDIITHEKENILSIDF